MNHYDVIVIGAGLTGSALAYELAQKNLKVLILEKEPKFHNATFLSYGGIFYWCGTNDVTNQLCQEARQIYRNLSEELEAETEFRKLDLLFTLDKSQNPQEVTQEYLQFLIKPKLLNVKESCELEPLLNPEAINGCLRFPQGHVNPVKTILAYQQALIKLGGKIEITEVNSLLQQNGKVTGVKTAKTTFFADQVIICAGAFSRQLLQEIGLKIPLYFTHAQLIKTLPTDIKLRTLVMPATTQRFAMEAEMTCPDKESLWDNPDNQIRGTVTEAGAIQFLDGSLCLGQISQIITNPLADIKSTTSETNIRESVGKILPSLSNLSGTWHNCQVAFTKPYPFQVGKISQVEGLSIFSGFTSPFVFVPPLAKHFANYLVNGDIQIGVVKDTFFKIKPSLCQ